MSTRLSVQFTGLCGIVPKLPITSTNNQATVLLADATKPPTGSHAHEHETHIPVLVCGAGLVAAGGRSPDLIFRLKKLDLAAFYLMDQEIKVVGAHADSLTFNTGASGGDCPVSAMDEERFDWTVSLSTISPGPAGQPGSGVVRSTCLDPIGSVDPAVLARVRLTRGEMRTRDLARDSSKSILKWDFRVFPHGTPIGQHHAITELLELSDGAVPNTVEFETRLLRNTKYDEIREVFGTGSSLRIRIDSQDDGTGTGNRIAQAVVKNVPLADLLGLRPDLPANHRDDDSHFEHFYGLSKTPRDLNVPTPLLLLPRCPSFTGPAPMNPQCPPALYEPDSGA
jgi:hypothetical protein